MKEIIRLVQSPVIEERLKEISAEARKKCERALSLECSEDNYKEIKNLRAELRKDFAEIEENRKGVEKTVYDCLKPFKDLYAELITKVYTETDNALKGKIEAVTSTLVNEKITELKEYFLEKAQSIFDGVVPEFITFEKANIPVTMSTSVSKVKKQIDEYLEARRTDITLITDTGDSELYAEYAKCGDLATAQLSLNKRRTDEAASKEFMQIFAEAKRDTKEHIDKIEAVAFTAPAVARVEDITPEDIAETTFTVRASVTKLIALKKYMIEEGIEIL